MSSLPASSAGMMLSNTVWSKLALTPSLAAIACERS